MEDPHLSLLFLFFMKLLVVPWDPRPDAQLQSQPAMACKALKSIARVLFVSVFVSI